MNGNGYAQAIQDIEQAVKSAPVGDLPRLVGDLACLTAMADLRVRTGMPPPSSQPVGEIRYLDATDVAQRFHVTTKWLYRHKKEMPYSQPSRKVLLFPEVAITKWFASRKEA